MNTAFHKFPASLLWTAITLNSMSKIVSTCFSTHILYLQGCALTILSSRLRLTNLWEVRLVSEQVWKPFFAFDRYAFEWHFCQARKNPLVFTDPPPCLLHFVGSFLNCLWYVKRKTWLATKQVFPHNMELYFIYMFFAQRTIKYPFMVLCNFILSFNVWSGWLEECIRLFALWNRFC